MGRKQRDSAFVNLTDEQIQALARDKSISKELRRRAQAEEKFRGLRSKKQRQRSR
ncbi:MAG: hypothetical protein JOZ73_08420 [Solirubrobacterales bacterium]|nr:hypothetical protein [Solirubrobacterales bacterium]